MKPDTLIFHLAGAHCRLDINLGAFVYVGSDVRADVCLQSSGINPAHCAIEVLANNHFRVATLDGSPTLTINGVVTHDLTVQAPFNLAIDNQELDVTLESLEKGKGEKMESLATTTDSVLDRIGAVDSGTRADTSPRAPDSSWLSGLFENTSFSRNTKIALAASLTLGGFYLVDKLWPAKQKEVTAMHGNMPDLADFQRQFTLGSFHYVVNSAERVSLDDDDDFDRYFADSTGPWKEEALENPSATSIYAVRMQVTNLDEKARQPFSTEFALTNLNQQQFATDLGASQTLMHKFEMTPMPTELEPKGTHECLVAFELPNEPMLGMLILIATERRFMKNNEARIGLNTQALTDSIMKLVKVLKNLADQPMIALNEMSAPNQNVATGNGLILPLGNGASMMFRFCEAGDFIMGSPTVEEGRHQSETPAGTTLTQGYWVAETECTQKQWSALMEANPSHFQGKELPVDSVTWDQAQEFIKRLNTLPHLSEAWRNSWAFALPTEAQWEHACRAGQPTSFNNGTFYSRRFGSASPAESIAWFADNATASTQLAGTKSANPWGLHDMHGNVWEWCQDWYYPRLLGSTDPEGPQIGTERVLRGGAFSSPESELRAARRTRLPPDAQYTSVGFRVVIVQRTQPSDPTHEVAQAQTPALE